MKIFEVVSTKMRLYHGTVNDISRFSGVAYFTPRQDAARAYARGKRRNKTDVARVYAVDVEFKNPKNFATMQQIGTLTPASLERLRSEGYDGAIYDGSGKEPIPEVVPLYPESLEIVDVEQVK